MVRDEVLAVLRVEDNIDRLQALREMLEEDTASTTSVLLEELAGTDKQLRGRAGWALSLLPAKESPEVAVILASHLESDDDAGLRLCCAAGLMSSDLPEALRAYIHAARDEDEKVAQLACMQLGFRGGAEATQVLFDTLHYPSWRLRLAACKALINLEAADLRTVAALKKMAQEPEAEEYDRQIEELNEINKQIRLEYPDTPEIEMWGEWGKLGTILEQAREIADRR